MCCLSVHNNVFNIDLMHGVFFSFIHPLSTGSSHALLISLCKRVKSINPLMKCILHLSYFARRGKSSPTASACW